MRRHGPVQTRHERLELLSAVQRVPGVLDRHDGRVELVHGVAVEVRQPQRVLGDHPARRDDGEVDGADPRLPVRRRREHREQARVVLVEQQVAHRAVPAEVVLVRVVGPVPGAHVEDGVVLLGRPEPPGLARDDGPGRVVGDRRSLFESAVEECLGDLKVPYVGEPGRADGTEVGQTKVALE